MKNIEIYSVKTPISKYFFVSAHGFISSIHFGMKRRAENNEFCDKYEKVYAKKLLVDH